MAGKASRQCWKHGKTDNRNDAHDTKKHDDRNDHEHYQHHRSRSREIMPIRILTLVALSTVSEVLFDAWWCP